VTLLIKWLIGITPSHMFTKANTMCTTTKNKSAFRELLEFLCGNLDDTGVFRNFIGGVLERFSVPNDPIELFRSNRIQFERVAFGHYFTLNKD
jgi:hypothetical protein